MVLLFKHTLLRPKAKGLSPLARGPQGVWHKLMNTPAAKDAASPLKKGGQMEESKDALRFKRTERTDRDATSSHR